MSFYTNELDLQPLQSSLSPSSSGWESFGNVNITGSSESAAPPCSSLGMDSISSTTTASLSSAYSDAFYHQFNDVDQAISNFTKHQPFNHHYAPNVHMNRNNRHNNNGNYNNNHGNHNNNNNNNNGNYNNNNRYQPNINNNNGGNFNNNNNSYHFKNNGNNNGQHKQYNNNGRKYQHQNGNKNNNNNLMMNQQQGQYNNNQQVPSRQQQLNNFPQYTQQQGIQQQRQTPFHNHNQEQQQQLNLMNNFNNLNLSNNSNQSGLSYDNIYMASASSPSSNSPNMNSNTAAHQLNQNLINSLRGSSSSPATIGTATSPSLSSAFGNSSSHVPAPGQHGISIGMNGFYHHQQTPSVMTSVSQGIWGMSSSSNVGSGNGNGNVGNVGNVWA